MRWDPFREMTTLRNLMDRMLDEGFGRGRGWSAQWPVDTGFIPLDVYEAGDNLIVKASVPGIPPEALNVQVREDTLTISGEVKEDKERKESDYHLREHRYGRFERSVTLPYSVKVDKAEAVFENGLLTLTLPKATETMKARQIHVKAK
jgi:HSP20 family protein